MKVLRVEPPSSSLRNEAISSFSTAVEMSGPLYQDTLRLDRVHLIPRLNPPSSTLGNEATVSFSVAVKMTATSPFSIAFKMAVLH